MIFFFFHPDFTVGTGISPVQSFCYERVADYTADREFHPAPKKIVSVFNCKDTTKSDEFCRNLFVFKFILIDWCKVTTLQHLNQGFGV
jgi:hypothetical protein